MPKYDQEQAECWVFTYKQGLLSPVAHDLRLRVTRFAIEVDDAVSSVSGHFDPSSLVVDTAMKDGAESPSALSSADKHKIEDQIRDAVLEVRKFPDIGFRSRSVKARADGGYELAGALSLHGVTRELNVATRKLADGQELELTLHQPDFGIEPYRAMLGALKLQSDVKIRMAIRAQRA